MTKHLERYDSAAVTVLRGLVVYNLDMPFRLLALPVLAFLLAACGSTPTPTTITERFVGTGQNTAATYNVSVEWQRRESNVVGIYTLSGGTRGEIAGTLNGSLFAGTLKPSTTCVYDVTGTLVGNVFDASFTVRECTLGQNGTWRLLRQ